MPLILLPPLPRFRVTQPRRWTTRGVDSCPAGPYFGTILANDASVGAVAWTNPANARLSDDVYASAITVVQDTQRLNATGFNVQIDPTLQIDGIVAETEAKVLAGTATVLCRIIKGGTVGATTKTNTWTTTEQFFSYGGATDLWGETWAPADINAGNFGVSVRQESALTSTLSCDSIRLTVYCSISVGQPTMRRWGSVSHMPTTLPRLAGLR